MTQLPVDPGTLQLIRRLAEEARFEFVSGQARSDMMSHNLTLCDVGDAMVGWIDSKAQVKQTVLHTFPGRQGQVAYEMKPKINGITFYVKVVVDDPGGADEGLALLSAHGDH